MLLIILFVFFFKQKTAYEMRISDWSSDVCSSDLVEGPPIPALFHEPEEGPKIPTLVRRQETGDVLENHPAGPKLCNQSKGDEGQVAARVVQPEPFSCDREGLAGASEDNKEIGRASCRERVCQ